MPPDYIPIDLNARIELTGYVVSPSAELSGQVWARVRYGDMNLQWSDWSTEKSFTIDSTATAVEDENLVVTEYKLYDNYPNPFNPSTTIQFDLKETSIVTLNIYNSLGELAAELVNETMSAGHYSRTLDASNLSSGIYYYRLKANNVFIVKKMTVMK